MKKNIFTIVRSYTDWQDELKREAQEMVLSYLKKDYNLTIETNLGEAKNSLGREVSRGIQFDAIISNVPPGIVQGSTYSSEEEKYILGYKKTLQYLGELKKIASSSGKRIPLIAYTSVKSQFEPLFRQEGVDAIIYKVDVNTWKNEANQIKQALESLIQ